MRLELKFYSSLCECEVFRINGIDADYLDFGTKEDRAPDDDDCCGCGNMRFIRKDRSVVILARYEIDEKEYDEICDKLTSGLSFGSCGLCQ